MKKIFITALAMSTPLFSCNECLIYYTEQKLYESELILDEMLDSHTEEDIPFFFYMLGSNNALYQMRLKMDEPCKADLHD